MRKARLQQLVRWVMKVAGLPVLGTVVGLLAALVVTALISPEYTSSASVVLLPKPASGTGEIKVSDVGLAQNLVFSVAELAKSPDVATAVAQKLGIPASEVVGHLSGSSLIGVQVATIKATADSASKAAAMATAATAAVADLAGRLNLGGTTITFSSVDTATAPTEPTTPKRDLNAALGALVGLIAGIGVLTLRSRVGDRFRRVTDIELDLGLPALGIIDVGANGLQSATATELYGRADIHRSVDGLVAALSVLVPRREGRRIVITSPVTDDSAIVTAALLAVALHTPARPVSVIDVSGDERGIQRFLPERPGIVNERGDDDGGAQNQPAEDRPAVALLTGGPVLVRDLDSTSSGADVEAAMTAGASSGVDVIVVAPSVMTGRTVAELAHHADVVILSIDCDRVRRTDAGRASLLVRRLNVPLAGTVVTGRSIDQNGWHQSAWPDPIAVTAHERGGDDLPTAATRRSKAAAR